MVPTHSRGSCIVDGRGRCRSGFLGQALSHGGGSCSGDGRGGGGAGGVDTGEPRSEVADRRPPCFGEGVDVFLRVYPAGPDCNLQVIRPWSLLPLYLCHIRLNPVKGGVEGSSGRVRMEEVRI